MAYIPKSAQRKIDTHRRSLARARPAVVRVVPGPIPRRLEVGLTEQYICNAYDVYLDGIKQRLCVIADVDKGYVKRFVRGIGNVPAPGKQGTELLFGVVEIVPKGGKTLCQDVKN